MYCSAAASSSAVVMPGATRSRTRASAPATTSPAARMLASWSAVLISMRALRPSTSALDRGEDAVAHLVDRAHAVHLDEDPLLGVDPGQRRRLLGVDLHAPPDDLL